MIDTTFSLLTILAILIHYVGFFIFGGKNNTLSCGLIGWVGKDPKKFDKTKFDLMGVWNEERGIHSCGVAIDGELHKGVHKEAKFRDFIANKGYAKPSNIPVVIGHTRRATGGSHTEANAHPFKFDDFIDEKDGYVIGAHNGVIKNVTQLCEKYGVEDTMKIDSEILLEILSKGNDNYEVLVDYIGYAALLMYTTHTPNSLWVFRGKSKNYDYANSVLSEERPLFFYEESKESMYISSLEEPLLALSDNPDKVSEFAPNYLYEIKEGQIVNRYLFDRTSSVQNGTGIRGQSTTRINKNNNYGFLGNSSQNSRVSSNRNKDTESHHINVTSPKITPGSYKVNNIFYEKAVFKDTQASVYYENLRYKDSNGLATGIFIILKDEGFYKIGNNKNEAIETLSDFTLVDEDANTKIKFGNCVTETKVYYIYQGVLLEKEIDFDACITHLSSNNQKKASTINLSYMSQYPVIDIDRLKREDPISKSIQHIMKDGHIFSGEFQPLGSFCSYKVDKGNITKYNLVDKVINPEEESDMLNMNEGDWSELHEGDSCDVFDENLSCSIEFSDSEKVIQVKNDVSESLIQAKTDLEEIENTSEITKMFKEFVNQSLIGFSPIQKGIEAMEEAEEHNH